VRRRLLIKAGFDIPIGNDLSWLIHVNDIQLRSRERGELKATAAGLGSGHQSAT
jgi:hypothetical protein